MNTFKSRIGQRNRNRTKKNKPQECWRTLCKKTRSESCKKNGTRAEENYRLLLRGPNNSKIITGVFARTKQQDKKKERDRHEAGVDGNMGEEYIQKQMILKNMVGRQEAGVIVITFALPLFNSTETNKA